MPPDLSEDVESTLGLGVGLGAGTARIEDHELQRYLASDSGPAWPEDEALRVYWQEYYRDFE